MCTVLILSKTLVLVLCPGTGTGTSPFHGPVCGPGTGTDAGASTSLGPALCLDPDLNLLVLYRSIVVIGAPKASNNQSGVEEGGAVYLCPWNTDTVMSSMCDVINLDAAGVLAPPTPPSPLKGATCCVCASDDVASCAR